jgi:hypothetical protein
MGKRIDLPDKESLRKFAAEITAQNQLRAAKFQKYLDLVIEAQKRITKLGRLSDQIDDSGDMLRAVVVLNHAYLEEFLRTLGRELLSNCDEAALNDIPLAKSDGHNQKFFLGRLSQFRGYMVDDLIDESVMEYLDKKSFSSHEDIIVFVKRLGFKLNYKMTRQLLSIGKMIKRRHQIVHRADRVIKSGKIKPELQSIGTRQVVNWALATSRFMVQLAHMHSGWRDVSVKAHPAKPD